MSATSRRPLPGGLHLAGQTTTPIRKLEAKAEGKPPSRANKVQVGAFVSDETRRKLKMLAIEQGRSVNDMIEESFQMLFDKYTT
ncbi:hypothetical protein TRICHSKD4_1258 [Roseibium sp. TrichSKD4]|uniref:ribbon-helix-helix domain-containing protein n=1 Tax=Roseibium sp. TrichSKD4 TaxID=744980 RepID=UPI0001E56564|nr:ribbon-helix-helix domain-containing protein [Roseibium sp. TrichSKD4]EFO33488.1 hypothetical protein TRICHSKD4_1258 [Roseibium sp. TrichSKD4]